MATSFLDQNFDDDEESETEFNPAAERGSDDEGSGNEDDTKDDNPPTRKAERRTPPDTIGSKAESRDSPVHGLKEDDEEEGGEDNGEDDEGEGEDLGVDDEDDENEDEDEDDEDEDAVTGRPRKRRRRGLNQFIEEEAEVDEDDDDLEADEDDIAETGFIQDTHPDDDLGPEADQDDRRHRELDRQRQLEASLDAEAAAQRLKERYGRRTTQGLSKGSFVPQNLLMPSVDDPSIWGVKCKPGKEKEVVMILMKKIQQRLMSGKPLKLCSAFERGGPNAPMQGYVFLEARRKPDVDEALQNVPNVYKSSTNLVPVN